MLDVIHDRRARLDQARADQAANDAALQDLEVSKSEASKAGREAFAEWKEEFDWRATERERLTVAIEALRSEIVAEDSVEAETALRDRHRRRHEENAKLADRIKSELAELNAKATALLRDVALAALEDAEINAKLPPDLEPLVSANTLARAYPGCAREEVGREQVSLWVRSDNGSLIGDQAAVTDLGIDKTGKNRGGVIEMRFSAPVYCRRMQFEQISFHPEIAPERPAPLWQMRLLEADSPAAAFDGTELSHAREVLKALNRATRFQDPGPRPVQKELRPLEPVVKRQSHDEWTDH
ncbi:hypothetical protein [Bradyrhizobium sp. th.b2]|uniref:hypothetical protein n=1 Tax=Bradyrhizobium sp. th-b2 TaxID=172088 RepID=UPI00048BEA45|nr:hypothetical protein [Bradyrhizobium sp. th.b2]